MIVVDRVWDAADIPAHAHSYARDTVTLGWEERMRAHGRRTSDGGIEFGTSLPRGTVLGRGDVFVLDEARVLVSVVERDEPVFVIAPASPHEWALFAYHIGNRHQPMMIANGSIVCPDAPGVEQLLQQHRMPYTRATLAFTPVAATGHHHHG
jgi:urease accessory protein